MSQRPFSDRFCAPHGGQWHLRDIDPAETDGLHGKKKVRKEIKQYAQRMRELQYLLYAEGKHSLLIVLQAMDAGGKDGTIRHVLGYMNPQGCHVAPFKVPTDEEKAHDFLWRVHPHAPGRGRVSIFNRSHYEDVLVVRVHDLVPEAQWRRRYDRINDFERLLADNGTTILKFFLHISPQEQLRRFRKRLENPAKQWKISEADYSERRYWDQYQAAYEDAIARCNTKHAPWFIIPADHKWFRNLAVSRIVVETLEGLNMALPPPSVDIDEIRCKYLAELDQAREPDRQ